MRSMITKTLCTLAACAGLAAPAAAQSFTGSETPYGSVKGWDVLSIADANGTFSSCGAVKTQQGNRVMLAQGVDTSWMIAVPTNQNGTFGGGILDIDKTSIDSQFEFIGGFALRGLSSQEVQSIRKGNQMGVVINGDGPERWWSLSGSAAAILKVTECVQRRGQVSAAAAPGPSPAPTGTGRASGFLKIPVPVGQKQVGDCRLGFGDAYRCTVEGLTPKSGFRSSSRVAGVFGNMMTLDLDAVSDTQADVWALMDGNWRFMGRWVADRSSGDCLVPGSNLSAEAQRNLGQDAWMLCLL